MLYLKDMWPWYQEKYFLFSFNWNSQHECIWSLYSSYKKNKMIMKYVFINSTWKVGPSTIHIQPFAIPIKTFMYSMLGKVYYYFEPPRQVSSPHLQANTLDSAMIIKLGLTLRNKVSLLRLWFIVHLCGN